ELDQRWARNMMLNKWLEYCLERGHRFTPATRVAASAWYVAGARRVPHESIASARIPSASGSCGPHGAGGPARRCPVSESSRAQEGAQRAPGRNLSPEGSGEAAGWRYTARAGDACRARSVPFHTRGWLSGARL